MVSLEMIQYIKCSYGIEMVRVYSDNNAGLLYYAVDGKKKNG